MIWVLCYAFVTLHVLHYTYIVSLGESIGYRADEVPDFWDVVGRKTWTMAMQITKNRRFLKGSLII